MSSSAASIQLSIFSSRLSAICDEMGAALQRSAFSPNIKDRLDFSCAIFDAAGQLSAQAAHIPVHLGSMAFAMAGLVATQNWQHGDVLVVNDPYQGGTHLPDVTVIAPVFVAQRLVAFVANRAHHANIGSNSPGSMPIASTLAEEGVVISPTLLLSAGQWCGDILAQLTGGLDDPRVRGDFYAQVSALQLGARRLMALIEQQGIDDYSAMLDALNHYAESLALSYWASIPEGVYAFTDWMDDDGLGTTNIPIRLAVKVREGQITVDFDGSSTQVKGNINCPLSVTAAAVYYCFRCLLPDYAPACAGTFRPIRLLAEQGLLVNARFPAAVAAGNVETSSRIVDAVFGALAIALPDRIGAASQGTMNNLAMGSVARPGQAAWDYYETLAGGGGASASGPGIVARHTHMTNTLNTPVESIEAHYPIRVTRYEVRRGSGGGGQHCGGDGVIREYEFLAPAVATLLTERRLIAPWAQGGAEPGLAGCNLLNGQRLPGKVSLDLQAGDILRIETPGGGGWNSSEERG